MRILMLSQFYPPVIGGEERHVVTLAHALAARGHEVQVATLGHPDRPNVIDDGGVSVHSVRSTMQRAARLFSEQERPHAPPFPDPELAWGLKRIIADFKPDVVHAHNWLLHSFLPLKRISGASFVVTLHDFSLVCARKTLMHMGAEICAGPSPTRCLPCATEHFGAAVGTVTCVGNWASSLLERRTVDRFIAVSETVARRSGLPAGDVPYDVLPTFISDDIGALAPCDGERLAALPKGDYLLFVGDLTRKKGLHTLLDAYALLSNAPPLVVIGRRCVDTPTTLPPNVTLLESWPHDAVMHAWSRCLFGLAPSIWEEACGTIVLEAHAVGRPMIASGIGGLADHVAPEETGLLVAPGDATALAAAMQTLIVDGNRRERMASACRQRAELFMAKTIVPKIEQIYRSTLQSAVSGGRALSALQQ